MRAGILGKYTAKYFFFSYTAIYCTIEGWYTWKIYCQILFLLIYCYILHNWGLVYLENILPNTFSSHILLYTAQLRAGILGKYTAKYFFFSYTAIYCTTWKIYCQILFLLIYCYILHNWGLVYLENILPNTFSSHILLYTAQLRAGILGKYTAKYFFFSYTAIYCTIEGWYTWKIYCQILFLLIYCYILHNWGLVYLENILPNTFSSHILLYTAQLRAVILGKYTAKYFFFSYTAIYCTIEGWYTWKIYCQILFLLIYCYILHNWGLVYLENILPNTFSSLYTAIYCYILHKGYILHNWGLLYLENILQNTFSSHILLYTAQLRAGILGKYTAKYFFFSYTAIYCTIEGWYTWKIYCQILFLLIYCYILHNWGLVYLENILPNTFSSHILLYTAQLRAVYLENILPNTFSSHILLYTAQLRAGILGKYTAKYFFFSYTAIYCTIEGWYTWKIYCQILFLLIYCYILHNWGLLYLENILPNTFSSHILLYTAQLKYTENILPNTFSSHILLYTAQLRAGILGKYTAKYFFFSYTAIYCTIEGWYTWKIYCQILFLLIYCYILHNWGLVYLENILPNTFSSHILLYTAQLRAVYLENILQNTFSSHILLYTAQLRAVILGKYTAKYFFFSYTAIYCTIEGWYTWI